MEETEEDEANYGVLPAEKQEYPLAFYKGACRDVIPWWAKKKCWEDEERERNMTNTAETRIQIVNYRPITASLETGIQWLRVSCATMLEEWLK